jgi:hypothetical protein
MVVIACAVSGDYASKVANFPKIWQKAKCTQSYRNGAWHDGKYSEFVKN